MTCFSFYFGYYAPVIAHKPRSHRSSVGMHTRYTYGYLVCFAVYVVVCVTTEDGGNEVWLEIYYNPFITTSNKYSTSKSSKNTVFLDTKKSSIFFVGIEGA